jgi:hypothetical protein
MSEFKVIVQTNSQEDDENVYHAIVFINPKTVETKELAFSETDSKLKATFTFPSTIIPEGDKFAVCLVAVDGGTEIDDIGSKIGTNSAAKHPEIIEFP